MKPVSKSTLEEPDEVCSGCGRPVRTYRRTITSAMAVALLLLYRFRKPVRFHPDRAAWLHLPSIKMRVRNPRLRAALAGGDAAKLRYWGLIEVQPGERQDGSRRTGLVRVTLRGEAFCRRRVTVRRTCNVRLGIPRRFHGPQISIDDALRNKFSYEAILGKEQ